MSNTIALILFVYITLVQYPLFLALIQKFVVGVCVAIGRYRWLAWAIVVGIGVLYLWFTVGGLRSPSNRVPLWVIRANQVAFLAATRGVGQSLLVFHVA